MCRDECFLSPCALSEKQKIMLKYPKNIPFLECLEDGDDKSNKAGIFLDEESLSSEFLDEELEEDILEGFELDLLFRRLDSLIA